MIFYYKTMRPDPPGGVPSEHRVMAYYAGSDDGKEHDEFPHLGFGPNPREAAKDLARKIKAAGFSGKLRRAAG